jgi:hypothetical protein
VSPHAGVALVARQRRAVPARACWCSRFSFGRSTATSPPVGDKTWRRDRYDRVQTTSRQQMVSGASVARPRWDQPHDSRSGSGPTTTSAVPPAPPGRRRPIALLPKTPHVSSNARHHDLDLGAFAKEFEVVTVHLDEQGGRRHSSARILFLLPRGTTSFGPPTPSRANSRGPPFAALPLAVDASSEAPNRASDLAAAGVVARCQTDGRGTGRGSACGAAKNFPIIRRSTTPA